MLTSQDELTTRQASYQVFERDFGYDIPKKSRDNINALKSLCRERGIECNEVGLTPLESEFKAFWDAQIAPLFIAVHRTYNLSSIMKDGALRSVTSRVLDLNKLGIAHASGRESLNRQVYFTFGLPGHLEQQHLYNVSCDRVVIHAGKATEQKVNPLPGLWLNNHIFEYGRNATTKGVSFGEYRRYIQYQKEGRQKHYIYQQGDKKVHTRTVSYGDEIFSAEEGMHHITDAMFYLFILDLFYLGDEAQDLMKAPNVEQITRLFNSLFPASETLEAKYVYKLDLNNPLVECKISTMTERLALAEFHYAINHSDIPKAREILTAHPEFIYMKSAKGHTALFSVIKRCGNSEKENELIDFLLALGADISQDDGFNDILIESLDNNVSLAQRLLSGIADNIVPNMKHFIAVERNRFNEYECCHKAIKSRADTVTKFILNVIDTFDDNDTVIITAFKACRERYGRDRLAHQKALDEIIPTLIKKGANLEAKSNRKSALMYCGEANDLVGIEYLISLGANLDEGMATCDRHVQNGPITVYADAGCTALHLAAAAQCADVVSLLLDNGANPAAVNNKGLNAAQYARLAKSKLREKVANENSGLRQFIFEAEAYKKFEDEQVAKQLSKLDDIIALIAPFVDSTDLDESVDYTSNQTVIHTVAMLTVTHFEDRDYVLVVRKANQQQRLTGHLMFPGGFLDGLNDNPVEAARRELAEETCLEFPEHVSIYKTIEYANRTHTFCIQRLSVDPTQHVPAPASDVGYASWVAIDEIALESIDDLQIARVDGCRFRHSNVLCLQKLGYLPQEDRDLFEQWQFEEYGSKEVLSAYENDEAKFIRCIHRGFDVTQTELFKKALYDNNEQKVRQLVDLGVDINQTLKLGLFHYIPLTSLTVMLQHLDLLKVMVTELGADATVCGTFSMLGEALRTQEKDMITWCLQVTPDDAEQALGIALLVCISIEDNEHFGQLIEKPIDLNKPYPFYAGQHTLVDSIQPLVLAAQLYRFDMMRLLIQSGAKVTLMDIHAGGPICHFQRELELANYMSQQTDEDESTSIFNERHRMMRQLMRMEKPPELLQQVIDILEPAATEEGHHYRASSHF